MKKERTRRRRRWHCRRSNGQSPPSGSDGFLLLFLEFSSLGCGIDDAFGVLMFDEEDSVGKELEFPSKEIFLPFQCFCIGKDIQFRDVILEDNAVTRARIEFVNHNIIENLVVGTGAKSGFLRFMATDIPGTLTKGAPDFCSVYVISKGKETAMRSASCSAPTLSPLADQSLKSPDIMTDDPDPQLRMQGATAESHRKFERETDFIR